MALAVVLLAVIAAAQPPAERSPPNSNNPTATTDVPAIASQDQSRPPFSQQPIEYVGPDTYILLDRQGRPQPVPGMTYEDFMAAWKQAQQLESAERQPRFTIESVQMDARAAGRLAELRFSATVHLLADGAVDVPLGLVGAVLQGRPEFRRVEPGENRNGDPAGDSHSAQAYADYDPNGAGFTAHFDGRASERYRLSLSLLVPLTNDGGGTTLLLTCPRAVFSKLTLDVNSPISEATAIGGTLIGKEAIAGGTRLAVAGVMGPFRLTWQTSEAKSDELATVLSAEGAVRISIDGRSVRSDARLTVRSYGGSFDRFRVRLPRGAQLIQRQPADSAAQIDSYRISLEDPASPAGSSGAAAQPIVLVELAEPQRGPVTVDLTTEQPLGLNDDLSTELDGFEVVGAVRQFGDVALMVASDWQCRWSVGRYVRQVDHDEIDPSLQSPEVTAEFQYDRQPWTIGLRIEPRQFRILVTPSYELEFTPEEARLNVRLAYQVMGARAFEFQVRLNGWELMAEPVESGGLVDREQMSEDEGILTLPLVQGSSRRAEIAFTLTRPLAREMGQLRVPLPVPIADSVGTGQLVVRAASGMNLLPDVTNSVGLTPATMVETSPAVSGDYRESRFRCLAPEVVFAAERVQRVREVLTDSVIEAAIESSEARVTQRVNYTVRYEPIKELVFEAPAELPLKNGDIEFVEISADGADTIGANGLSALNATSLSLPASVNASESPVGPRQIRVPLARSRIGEFSVEARYRFRKPNRNAKSGAWKLPLLRPTESSPRSLRATVIAPQNATVSIDSKAGAFSWNRVSPTETDIPVGSFVFRAERPEMYLPVSVTPGSSLATPATAVERIWLQTWIAPEKVQERAAFRLRTSSSRVTIELAPQTPETDIEVLVDRRPARIVSRDPGQLIIELTPDRDNAALPGTAPAPYTVELRYRRSIGRTLLARHILTPPQIVGATSLSDIYWQIILPGDHHIVRSPAQFAAADEWQWLGSVWGRRPTHTQTELEQWSGASSQPSPSLAQNAYLYTGLAPLATIQVITAPRWFIVLVASGGVLALALLWMYVPVVRRGWVLALLACILAASAIAFPAPAMFVGQAALLGIGLAMVASLIYWALARPATWTVVAPSVAPAQRHSTVRPDSIVLTPAGATASTAPTASVRVPDTP